MPSELVKDSLPFGRRELMNRIGKEGEEEVGKMLSQEFGYRNVSVGIEGHSKGTDGYPDIKLVYNDNVFFIEVKSICPFVKSFRTNKETKKRRFAGYRANSVKVNRHSYDRLMSRAKAAIATIILIVELRIPNGINDYFILNSDTIEDFMDKTKAEWVHIPLWYILNNTKKLEFNESEFIVNTVETTQRRLNL